MRRKERFAYRASALPVNLARIARGGVDNAGADKNVATLENPISVVPTKAALFGPRNTPGEKRAQRRVFHGAPKKGAPIDKRGGLEERTT